MQSVDIYRIRILFINALVFRINIVFLQKEKYINKESEVIMPEFEHNREERIDAVIHEILSSKENAIRFMQEAGLYDTEGHLMPRYR